MKKTSVFGLVFLLLVSDCVNEAGGKAHLAKLNQQIQEQAQLIDQLKQQNEELAKKAAEWQTMNDERVLSAALAIVEALKAKDMDRLAMYVHPDKGVRFSPYGHVDIANDVVFAKDELPSLMESSRIYRFGTFDGSGEPIMMTFSDYFQKFVYGGCLKSVRIAFAFGTLFWIKKKKTVPLLV
ncbi:septum formation initiator family protein [Geobacillus sp. 46C-IIa]|uniref:FtsB family cell division protein n=1 Tax=Geobacillus sp. 46C-IIa TaxID=1963025 RepID=UPI001CC1F71C|nr:YebO family protein [Geobacillus sp. 46C-IIa]